MLDKILVVLIATLIANLVVTMKMFVTIMRKNEELREIMTKSNEQLGYDIKRIRKEGK